MRGEYKTPGGKLVGVTVACDPAGFITSCSIDGDFFMEGEESEQQVVLGALADALRHGDDLNAVFSAHPHVQLIGADADAFLIAFHRAVGNGGAVLHSTAIRDTASSRSHAATISSQAHRTLEQAERKAERRRRARWQALKPEVIHDTPRMPQEQMDIDIRLAERVAAGKMPPTLRFWEWAAPAVVIGRFQSLEDEVNLDQAQQSGFAVVRRCTGGGAMFIEPGNTITYSLYAPRDFVAGMDIEESYRLCDQWLIDALRDLGIEASFSSINDISSSSGKIAGAAQRRFPPIGKGPGAVLHHVTMAYDIDAVAMSRVLRVSQEKMSDKAVKSAIKRVDPLRSQTGLSRHEIVDRLIEAARRQQPAVMPFTLPFV